MLTTRRGGRLGRFSQHLEETKHFCGRGQEKVAKIVHCGEKIEEEAIRKGGLKPYDPFIIERCVWDVLVQ
jgi:beta-glucosidase-like glycosyl hydrolase